jgi:aqualysin 1
VAFLQLLLASGASASHERYIVTLEDGASSSEVAREHGNRFGTDVEYVYGEALEGYAARIPPGRLGEVRADPRVDAVEPDGRVTASTTQSGATWGLDRIDQRSLPLSTTFTYSNTGAGVNVYVIDTGIRFSHSQFGGRAVSGYDAIDGGSADDCNGHGTHVAGTTGGTTYGVAKQTTLVAVRVLNCSGSGSYAGVIAGVNWVAGHTGAAPAVANMSLGGPASSALDTAVQNSIRSGITYAVAAGNDYQDACRYSPSRVPEAVTVSATDSRDGKPNWANSGSCVDLFAPGSAITSAWHTGDTATRSISGTSMASPHAAGVAALYLEGRSGPDATPQAVRDALWGDTTKGIVKRAKSTNSHLLYTNW